MKYTIEIDGMGCTHCVNSVIEGLTALGASVESCEIGKAIVEFAGDAAKLTEAIEDRGFTVTAIKA